MIVYNLNVFCVRACPAEAYSKLIVHADTVLAITIAFKSFQSVTRWNAYVP